MRPFADDVPYQKRLEVLDHVIASLFECESHNALVKVSRRLCQTKLPSLVSLNPSKLKNRLKHFLAARNHILNELKTMKSGTRKVQIWDQR